MTTTYKEQLVSLSRENKELFSYLQEHNAIYKYGGNKETGENFRIYYLEGANNGFLNLFENTTEGVEYSFSGTGYYYVGYWSVEDANSPSLFIQTDNTEELIRFMDRFVV